MPPGLFLESGNMGEDASHCESPAGLEPQRGWAGYSELGLYKRPDGTGVKRWSY